MTEELREVSGTARRDALAVAKLAVEGGAKFGSLYPVLETDADRAAFREWFCRTPGVPVNPVKPPGRADRPAATLPAPATAESRSLGYTGNACWKCQSVQMVRAGPCEKCLNCGETSGGCS